MQYMAALFVVENIERSRFLFEELLGQNVKTDFGENVCFHGDFAIHEKNHYRSLIDNRPVATKSHNAELYFEDDDVDAVAEKLSHHNYVFVHPVKEQPWRQRVLRFYDDDGHIIEIGETMEHVAHRLRQEGKSKEEICAITYLPMETVEGALRCYGDE